MICITTEEKDKKQDKIEIIKKHDQNLNQRYMCEVKLRSVTQISI